MQLGLLALFSVGFALGMKSEKWLPPLEKKVQPLGKAALKLAVDVADKAKDAFWEKGERFADVIAEIKEEQEKKAAQAAPQYDV